MTASDPDPAAAPVPPAPGELLADLDRRHDEVLVELGRLEAQVEQVLVDWTRGDAVAEAPAAPAEGATLPRKPAPGRGASGDEAAPSRPPARRNRSA